MEPASGTAWNLGRVSQLRFWAEARPSVTVSWRWTWVAGKGCSCLRGQVTLASP